jgi:AAHS family 4-hydroxybenzoate transporter-like MFS transporter
MPTGMRTIDVTASIERRRFDGFYYGVIALSWLITAFDGLDGLMIGFTLPYMRDELDLTTTMMGYIAAAGNAGTAVGGFLSPLLADRIGRRPTTIAMAFMFGVLTTATALAGSYEALVVMRFVNGLALGGLLPLAWALNIEFVPKRMRATVVTIIMVGYSVGSALAGPLTNALGPTHGWQGVYVAGGLGTLVCAVALWIWLPESIRFLTLSGRRPDAVARTLRRLDPTCDATADDRFVLSDEIKTATKAPITQLFAGPLRWVTPLLWLGFFMSSLGVFFTSSFGPTVLEKLGFPRPTAALVKSSVSIVGAALGLLLMRFTDRKGPIALAAYPAAAVPVLLVVGFGLLSGDAFLAMTLLGTGLVMGGHFGVQSIAGVYYPSAIRSTGGGFASGVAKFGAVLGPIVGAAVLSSQLPVVRTYALLAICPAALCLCALGIARALRRGEAASNPAHLERSTARAA